MAFRHKTMILALAATLALGFAGDSFARIGGGFSFGSRGACTFSAPSATPQAPQGAAPIERSMTSPNENIFRRPSPYASGGFFSGGFDPAVPQQATEVWTFARRLGAPQATGDYRRYNKPDERGIAGGVRAPSHPDAGMFWLFAGGHPPCKGFAGGVTFV